MVPLTRATRVVLALVAACLVGAVWSPPVAQAAVTDLPLDTTFNPTGPQPGVSSAGPSGTTAGDIVPLRDGSMIVLGFSHVAKLTATGQVDATYGNPGTPGALVVPTGIITAHVIDHNEELYVGDGLRIWRISPTGAITPDPIYEVHSTADLLSAVRPG